MNETKLMFNLGTLKHFINNSLSLSYEKHSVTGYELVTSLIEASAYNTYVETTGNKSDTLYLRIKECFPSMTCDAYLNYIKRVSKKFELQIKMLYWLSIIPTKDFLWGCPRI